MLGVEITDSEYVVASMKIMTRMGAAVLPLLDAVGDSFVKCLHSVGAPLDEGQADVPWPCSDTKYISHFPESREIWSYGSGYGGNALLGKKCYALRIASAIAHDEGWLAEHMLILKLISPEDKAYYVAAAFPSACGKTNLAMLQPTIPGWRAETVGDDIAWMRFGEDGRLYARQPGVRILRRRARHELGAPTRTPCARSNRATRCSRTSRSPMTVTSGGRAWKATRSTSRRGTGRAGPRIPTSRPRTRTPATPCRSGSARSSRPSGEDPNGVPISAILFGGRRKTTVPLVTEARDWQHGTFMGATMSSEMTAAAKGGKGQVRRDPMAMLPFLGYNVGDYFQHWVDVARAPPPTSCPRSST